MEHTRTSPEEQGAAPATGADPGIRRKNTYDPDDQRAREPAQQPPGPPGEQSRSESVSVEAAVEKEIMSQLPRKRPQRRGTRRTTAQGSARARKGTARSSASKKASTKRASTARRSTGTTKAKAKNNPSLPEQAIGAVISTARLPLRIGAGLGRRANDVINRIR